MTNNLWTGRSGFIQLYLLMNRPVTSMILLEVLFKYIQEMRMAAAESKLMKVSDVSSVVLLRKVSFFIEQRKRFVHIEYFSFFHTG